VDKAALSEIEFAGWVYDMAFRLRGSTTSPADRVRAIGSDVGLGSRALRDVVVTLEQLGWITVDRNATGEPLFVTETMPPAQNLVSASDRLFALLHFGGLELAALDVLRATTIQPLVESTAIESAMSAGATEEEAREAIRHLAAIKLVRRVVTEDARDVLYNPNVWTQGDEVASAALRAADARATREVQALIEEIAQKPALPEAHVSSTDERWIKFAVAQGLVQRSVIQTDEGDEQAFLFTPHVARDPFGGTAGDASGQVRQLVGSMIYATTFARYQLWSPQLFLRRLIRDGVAGHASSIGTDYTMLEKAGIVRALPGSAGRFRMELLQSDVAEDALRLLSSSGSDGTGAGTPRGLSGQSGYVHIETGRARLAMSAESDEIEQRRLISALRDVSIRRSMGI
jgi:hypothetical protein